MNTKAPIIQQHELTTRCNNNCGFCYNPERCISSFNPRNEEIERNIKVAEISVEKGVMAACPTGGEPLLVGNHLFDVLTIYKNAGCYTSINTNARLATDKIASKLSEMGLNSTLTSLHGIGQLHDLMVGDPGAFNETWRGMLTLKKYRVPVMPNLVATAKNMHGLVDVGRTLRDAGFSSMTVTPFLPSWGASEHMEYLLTAEHYKKYFQSIRDIRDLGIKIDSTLPIPPCALIKIFPDNWQEYVHVLSPRVCMAGKSFGVVSPDGNFRACIQAPFLKDYGGSLEDNYEGSWQRANQWADKALLPDECYACAALNICGGGCRTSCLWENNGNTKGKTMYMGNPLTENEAGVFFSRSLNKLEDEKSDQKYSWRNGIKFRDEGWGTIVFNPALQSFTVISDKYYFAEKNMASVIQFSTPKTAAVLKTIGAIRPANVQDEKIYTSVAKVLPAQMLLPRMGKNMDRRDIVYCLRADTGERYFF